MNINNLDEAYLTENESTDKTVDDIMNNKNFESYLRQKPVRRPYTYSGSHIFSQMYRRFMDNSYDHYNQQPIDPQSINSYGYGYSYLTSSNSDLEAKEDKRIMQIKKVLTVVDWDILNGTNFMSPPEQIEAYIAIIKKLIDAGVID